MEYFAPRTMASEERIVLTGATGNTGQVIASELQQRGVPFVAMVRSEKNRRLLEERGIQTVHGDFDSPKTLDFVLRNTKKAYLVSTPDETLIPRETAFIEAAKRVGVQHIVKCSAYLAAEHSESKNLTAHGVIERTLRESGLAWTVLRPHGFMQTFTLFGWDLIQQAGVLTFPAGDGAMPLIDVRDVATVAVKALTEEGHEGKAYDLTGSEALRFDQIAAIMTSVLGRKVVYLPGNDIELDMVSRVLGVPEVPREHVLKIARMVREHRLERVHDTLQTLGITPITYEQFLRDLVAGKTGGGNSFTPPDTLLARTLQRMSPTMMKLRLRFQ